MLQFRVKPRFDGPLALFGLLLLYACTGGDGGSDAPPPATPPKRPGPPVIAAQPALIEASLRAVDVWDASTVWVSGAAGSVLKSTDGGRGWEVIVVPGGEELDFRDVEILEESTVLLMSVGNGDASRIFRTTDAGESWELVFSNTEERAFFNSFAFWDADDPRQAAGPEEGRDRLHP